MILANTSADTGLYENILSLYRRGAAELTFDSDCDDKEILSSYNLKLKISSGGEVGGIFDEYSYRADNEEYTGSYGSVTFDSIDFSSYKEVNKTIDELISAFDNGQDLYCEIELS